MTFPRCVCSDINDKSAIEVNSRYFIILLSIAMYIPTFLPTSLPTEKTITLPSYADVWRGVMSVTAQTHYEVLLAKYFESYFNNYYLSR